MSVETDGPTTLDFDVSEDGSSIIIGAERGDLSIVVESPRNVRTDEIEEILEQLPESIAAVDELARRSNR
jgi:hypothetical protein